MNATSALVWAFLFLLILWSLLYYGARLKFFASLVLAFLLATLILGCFYPPSRITETEPDFALAVYMAWIVVFLIVILVYILLKALCDRQECCY